MAWFRSKKKKEEVLSPRQIAIGDFLKKNYNQLRGVELRTFEDMYRLGYVYANIDGTIHTTERGEGILTGRIKYKPGVPQFLKEYMELKHQCTDTDGSQS